MHTCRIAEYDRWLQKWTARGRNIGNSSDGEYIDWAMRNKWTPGANYSRGLYRVTMPDCRRLYYFNGRRISRRAFYGLMESPDIELTSDLTG